MIDDKRRDPYCVASCELTRHWDEGIGEDAVGVGVSHDERAVGPFPDLLVLTASDLLVFASLQNRDSEPSLDSPGDTYTPLCDAAPKR